MERSYPEEWDKLIGAIPARVIYDLARNWVFKAYFENEPAACLGIGIIPRKRTSFATPSHISIHEWFGELVDKSFLASVHTEAMNSYEDVISGFEKNQKEATGRLNGPFYGCTCLKEHKGIPYMAYGVLRTEDHIYYAFAPYRTTDEVEDTAEMLCSFFELIYVICRAIAPQSNYAFDLVQNKLGQPETDFEIPYEARRYYIAHAEKALSGSEFLSVIAWRHQ